MPLFRGILSKFETHKFIQGRIGRNRNTISIAESSDMFGAVANIKAD